VQDFGEETWKREALEISLHRRQDSIAVERSGCTATVVNTLMGFGATNRQYSVDSF